MNYLTLPERFAKRLELVRRLNDYAQEWQALSARKQELPFKGAEQELATELMAIAMNPKARAQLETLMDEDWAADRKKNIGMGSRPHEEIVIGSGYHAAVYCAVRVANGHPPPLVVEQNDRVGGAFAPSRGPSFWSNSRNRPGPANVPGSGGALNTIPGALIQPSMISADEFQSNADIAFAIRLALALYAKVATGKRVRAITRGNGPGPAWSVSINSSDDKDPTSWTVRGRRVIDARGMGIERVFGSSGRNVITFSQFMARMDEPFPLRGLRRVAVVGGGDSGKCAVEALFGMSPARHMSVPDLDRIEQCDWYAGDLPKNCEGFRDVVRGRYRRLASLLPSVNAESKAPVRVIRTKADLRGDYYGAIVNERRYDLAIFCGGFSRYESLGGYTRENFGVDRCLVAIQESIGIFAVGPVANLGFTELEATQSWSGVPENAVAMWRLGPRTGLLAQRL